MEMIKMEKIKLLLFERKAIYRRQHRAAVFFITSSNYCLLLDQCLPTRVAKRTFLHL
jgi:hypothetical protein